MAEVFFEEFIKKREVKKKWIQYWVVLKGDKMYLYVSRDRKDVEFCEIIQLSRGSRCILLKRRTYSFRFRLTASDEHHYFKCDSNLQRHRWIHMIHLASSGRSPESPPNHINMRCCFANHEKQAMDIANSSRWKSSSLEKIVEDREIVEEATEEKEDGEEIDASEETCASEEMDQNNNEGQNDISSESVNSTESLKFGEIEASQSLEDKNPQKESEINPSESMFGSLPANESLTREDNERSPAISSQTWSLKTFTFGSFRKSLRRQSFPPKEENKSTENSDQIGSDSLQKCEEENGIFLARFSMDNPAFTDDDTEEKDEENSLCQPSRIINVSPCND